MQNGNTYTSNAFGTGTIISENATTMTVRFSDGSERCIKKQSDKQKAKSARQFAEKLANEEITTFTKLIDGMGGFYNNNPFSDEARNIVVIVSAKCNGFAKDVANTVLKSGRVSEKQAAIIAKAFDLIKR